MSEAVGYRQTFKEYDNMQVMWWRENKRVRKLRKKIKLLQNQLDELGVWPEPLFIDTLFE